MVQGTLYAEPVEVEVEGNLSGVTVGRDPRGFTTFDGPLYDVEWALEKAGLDWEVEKRDVFIEDDRGARRLDGYKATVGVRRDGSLLELGVVSDDYGIVNNLDAARMMAPLLENGRFQIARAGMTARGRVWMMVRNEQEHDVTGGGDFIHNHMTGIWDHAAGKSLSYAFMGNRLACDNAIFGALYDLERGSFVQDNMSFRHTSGVHHTMNTVRQMFATFDRAQEINFKFMRRLAQKNLTKTQIGEYVSGLFPYAFRDDMTEEQKARRKVSIDRKREKVLALHEQGMGMDVAPRGTAWAVYSAVTEYIDHGLPANSRKDFMDYTLFGSGQDLRELAIKRIVPLVA